MDAGWGSKQGAAVQAVAVHTVGPGLTATVNLMTCISFLVAAFFLNCDKKSVCVCICTSSVGWMLLSLLFAVRLCAFSLKR